MFIFPTVICKQLHTRDALAAVEIEEKNTNELMEGKGKCIKSKILVKCSKQW